MNYQRQLQSILKASGWTQAQLAQRLGVSLVTLNTWANGHSQPRPKARMAIGQLQVEVLGADAVDPATVAAQTATALKLRLNSADITGNQAVVRRLILHLTYHTDAIEGSTMTLRDTEAVLFEQATLSNRTAVEQTEVRNHQAALLWLLEHLAAKDFAISEELVAGLHLRLMNGIASDAGQYRRHGVRIMGSRVVTANYLKVPYLMRQLIPRLHLTTELVRNLAVTHAQFEQIHPFGDGNGRVGRLLLLAMALRNGVVPPIVVKDRRWAYYKYLELAQMQGQPAPLELFVAEAVSAAHQLLFPASSDSSAPKRSPRR